jgi:hypothetical protein
LVKKEFIALFFPIIENLITIIKSDFKISGIFCFVRFGTMLSDNDIELYKRRSSANFSQFVRRVLEASKEKNEDNFVDWNFLLAFGQYFG